ncbi:uncharacterized protein LOC125884439 isoform X3 [Epinephelus fuscoguttatus]|uniref:uncharacterized protein LOC125884439 isoform X2 n=1 Tax=Epinephelus fuscoguttatus TaxID=293821 RepID=UPI0020D0CA6F|nr:uncharacterized protein LOC125884439 isoform X2 [Epinephelus fuscoguttatus]XP_049425350.1 uncharacterized protein LOC125884439 isoform X3 [Epinephelus fuscoguttatus]
MREKMMCIILLLINLTSCVCGTFVVNVTQTCYQAEENHNITLEFMFTTKPGSSLKSLFIYCELKTDLRATSLFHLHNGVEVPESQDEQFTGRVQCDKDVLREGRLRLHVSRLSTNDSGLYMCEDGDSTATCRLTVTAAKPKRVRPMSTSAPPQGWEWTAVYCSLGLIPAAAGLGLLGYLLYRHFRPRKWRQRVRQRPAQRPGQGQESNNSINTLNNFKPRQPDSCSDHSDGSESAPHSVHASLETAAMTNSMRQDCST